MDRSNYIKAEGRLSYLGQFKASTLLTFFLCFSLSLLFLFREYGRAELTDVLRDTADDMGMFAITASDATYDISGQWNSTITIVGSTCSSQPVGQTKKLALSINQTGSDISISNSKISWGRPDEKGNPMNGDISGFSVDASFVEPPKDSDTECPTCAWAIYFSATLSDDGNSLGGILEKFGSGSECSWSANFSAVRVKKVTPKIVVNPKSVNLGSVKMGTSSSKVVTISNQGSSYLAIGNVSVTGTNATEFSQTNTCSDLIPVGASCTVTVTLTPITRFGAKNASVAISSNDPHKSTVNVKLSGQAPPPKITVAPQSVNFGSVNSKSAPKTVTVKNTGISDLTVNAITFGGTNAAEFGETDNCSKVSQGSSCAIIITLSPTSDGTKSARMSISSNDPKKSNVNVKLTGSC